MNPIAHNTMEVTSTEVTSTKAAAFRRAVMGWYAPEVRNMPWAGETDPYKVWLSEVILQQTQVEQGRPYYEVFVERFPSVGELASATEDEVLRLWQGLGYYSRARNLHKTARIVAGTRDGMFPSTYDELLMLPGIGPYTAAAIASLSRNLPHAVVDGNVIRALARYFGIDRSVSTAGGKRIIESLAERLLDRTLPGRYNQALMNFGALQCRPRNPDCASCPLKRSCRARGTGRVEDLPIRNRPLPKTHRWFNYLVVWVKGSFLIRKRIGDDIWKGLYEFPLIETAREVTVRHLSRRPELKALVPSPVSPANLPIIRLKQTLSHRVVHARFIEIGLNKAPKGFLKVKPENMHRFAFPRVINWYLEESHLP